MFDKLAESLWDDHIDDVYTLKEKKVTYLHTTKTK